MTYIAIRRAIPVNAAAGVAGPTDLRLEQRRAAFVDGDDPGFRRMGWPGWRTVWPVFDRREAELMSSRPAVDWPGEIDVPVLLLRRRSDSRVTAEHTSRLATLLHRHTKEYGLPTKARQDPASEGWRATNAAKGLTYLLHV